MKKLICILILIVSASTIKAAFVEKIEVKKESTKTKIVILSGSLDYKNLTLHNPERIVIDFQNAFSRVKPKMEVDNSPIMSIRSSQYKHTPVPVTRIVIDLEQPAEYSLTQIGNGIELSFAGNSSVPGKQPKETKTSEESKPPEETVAPATPPAKEEKQEEIVQEEISAAVVEAETKPDTSYIDSLYADSLSIIKESVSQDTIRKDTLTPLKEPFFYNSRGKRDPFRPWLGIESGSSDSLLDISTSTIVGIMWSPKDRYALAQDNTGKGYVLCEGDKVWNGKVESIEKDNVVFALHGFGGIKKITLKLLPKEERKKEEQ